MDKYYILGLPIKHESLGTIYQPKIMDIINGLDHSEIVNPFYIIENINAKSEYENKFELVQQLQIMSTLSSYMDNDDKANITNIYPTLINSLSIIYKTTDINWCDIGMGILIAQDDKEVLIDGTNFDILCDIVFDMFQIDKKDVLKKQDEPEDEIQKEFAKARKEYLERNKSKKKEMTIFDMINYIIHYDNSNFTYESVLDLTIYQVYNTFKLYREKEVHNVSVRQYTSGKFKMDKFPKHWILK